MNFQFIAIGASLGGFQALKTVLGGLQKYFPLPVAVVQHRSYEDSDAFAPLLGRQTQLHVVDVDDEVEIKDGHVYVCPSNYHVVVDGRHFALASDAAQLHARPSIDVLFESAAESFGDRVIGILLTVMSKDGTA